MFGDVLRPDRLRVQPLQAEWLVHHLLRVQYVPLCG
jgi:hypothetical protein